MKVGYIGLGAMGGTLARHLIQAHELVVYDLSETVLEQFRQLGAGTAATSRQLAETCDVVVLCLPKSADVGTVLFGEGGIARYLRSGQLIIDQTSGSPEVTASFARKLSPTGVLFLDAPVSGGIPAAQSRAVTVIASGSDAAWQLAEPILAAMSTKVFRCGANVGDGQSIKLITNGIGACYRLATLELAALGRRYGLSLGVMVPAFNGSTGANFTTRYMLVGLVEGRSTTNFAMKLMVKDLNAALELAATTQTPVPMLASARGLMQTALALIGESSVLDDVVPLIEKLTGTVLARDTEENGGLLVSSIPTNELVTLLADAAAACNAIAVLEGAAVARRLGLEVHQLARVIEAGSAWSRIAGPLLEGEGSDASRLARYVPLHDALEATARLAADAGAPFLAAGSALSGWRSGDIPASR